MKTSLCSALRFMQHLHTHIQTNVLAVAGLWGCRCRSGGACDLHPLLHWDSCLLTYTADAPICLYKLFFRECTAEPSHLAPDQDETVIFKIEGSILPRIYYSSMIKVMKGDKSLPFGILQVCVRQEFKLIPNAYNYENIHSAADETAYSARPPIFIYTTLITVKLRPV